MLEVPALVREAAADRVHALAFALEVARGRVDGEPVDFEIGLELAQLARDREVALNGAEPISSATLDAFAEAFGPCGFDRRSFFPTYGLAECTLMATGPLAGGLIYDSFASYAWLYIGSWAFGLGAFAIALTFRPFARPEAEPAPVPA